jgi:outer membrane protein OmpA-like peptidoglycan-associated protein
MVFAASGLVTARRQRTRGTPLASWRLVARHPRASLESHPMNRTLCLLLACSLSTSALVTGCASSGGAADGKRGMTNAEKGAVIGAVGGAVVGAAVSDRKGKGALVGAVGGGLAGGAIGAYMDNQKQDLEKNLAKERPAGNARVEKLPGDVIRITMTNQTAFDTGSADIKPAFGPTMDRLAEVVTRYGKTTLTIVGHTDAEGSKEFNLDLSRRRTQAVADYFRSRNVNPARLEAIGKGESEPVASNRSEACRQSNRRVEILVEPVRA